MVLGLVQGARQGLGLLQQADGDLGVVERVLRPATLHLDVAVVVDRHDRAGHVLGDDSHFPTVLTSAGLHGHEHEAEHEQNDEGLPAQDDPFDDISCDVHRGDLLERALVEGDGGADATLGGDRILPDDLAEARAFDRPFCRRTFLALLKSVGHAIAAAPKNGNEFDRHPDQPKQKGQSSEASEDEPVDRQRTHHAEVVERHEDQRAEQQAIDQQIQRDGERCPDERDSHELAQIRAVPLEGVFLVVPREAAHDVQRQEEPLDVPAIFIQLHFRKPPFRLWLFQRQNGHSWP